jgi:hypothetical protein
MEAAIQSLRLPLIRQRKLSALCNALEMQVEDGGDHPEVNALLAAALRWAALHQVSAAQAAPLLRAIDEFEGQERERWERIRQGLPCPRSPVDILDELTIEGMELLESGRLAAGCARCEMAWQLVRRDPALSARSAGQFSAAHGPTHRVTDWVQSWLTALEDLGVDDPACRQRRQQVAREYLARFPDEPAEIRSWFLDDCDATPADSGRPMGSAGAARRSPPSAGVNLGRNELCWCGSGRKYKACHLAADRE